MSDSETKIAELEARLKALEGIRKVGARGVLSIADLHDGAADAS
jgi:hypothetical protein